MLTAVQKQDLKYAGGSYPRSIVFVSRAHRSSSTMQVVPVAGSVCTNAYSIPHGSNAPLGYLCG